MTVEEAVKEARRKTFEANRHLGISAARRAAAEAEKRTRAAWAPPVPIRALTLVWLRSARRYVQEGETVFVRPDIAAAAIKQGYFVAGSGKPPAQTEAPPILVLGEPDRSPSPGWGNDRWVRLRW